jgi:2,3-dihydroxybenzoate-AMP ligase
MSSEELTPWPNDLARRYREKGYWTDETLGGFLRARARCFGDRVAVRDARSSLSYADLDRAADAVAALLREREVRLGERVLVQIDNRAELYIVHFALFRIGAVPIFAQPSHGSLETGQFCRIAEPVMAIASSAPGVTDAERARALAALDVPSLRHRIVIADSSEHIDVDGVEFWSEVPRHAPGSSPIEDAPSSGDLAFLQLSGGSTGIPKLIPRTHADYLYSVRGSAEICALTPDDVMYIAIPAAHNYPYSSPGALGMWHAGGTVVLSESPDPDACLPGLLATGATIVPLVPAVAHLWLMAQESAPRAFPRLRLIQVGGAKLSRDIALSIERVFETRVQQVFGMAEGLVNYTRLDDDQFTRTTTQGRRISPDDEVRIVDDSDIDVPMGADGHLITRGPYTIRGYYRNPDADDASFTEDGWYRTGDIARLDERGYLTVTGRAKAVINRGGEKIAPEEVEFHLHAHPEIVDAVVIGIDDDVLGERTRALVVARRQEEISVREVRGWLRDRGLAAFKVPDQVRFVDRLERTGVGKNRRPSRTAAAQMTTGETR